MSTYFAFAEPMTRQEMETFGVIFFDGEIQLRDGKETYTWIISTSTVIDGETQYLHPNFFPDGLIYGFTRYGNNGTKFLTDILEENFISYVDEYQIQDMYIPTGIAAVVYGISISDEEVEEKLSEALSENFCDHIDMYFSRNRRKFIMEWLNNPENKKDVIESFKMSED